MGNSVPSSARVGTTPVRTRSRDRQWDVTVAVTVGGVLGAEARYGLSTAMPHDAPGFPWSTFCINVVGAFCLGVLMALLGQLSSPHRLVRPFVGVGILGGFTTFSTFTVDAERLIEEHRSAMAGLYVLGTLLAAMVAVAAATIAVQLLGRYVYHRRLRRADASRSRGRVGVTEPSGGRR